VWQIKKKNFPGKKAPEAGRKSRKKTEGGGVEWELDTIRGTFCEKKKNKLRGLIKVP